ncbi:putative RNA-directed DNA polymerase from transposon X-element [Araneus ventricosus]|uniref:Putative RNA-directed DNA polymerase from transposon X-element n=1 Tax=Araneus ventricosus TaxID=182803 RepID=A0A4Y2AF36_ARAVE|nr:putative RNA-directed DNA polymerase from transposon X-element [Araneus ventricosus]
MGPLKKPPFSGQPSNQIFDAFFIVTRVTDKNEYFSNVSPFLVEKAITGSVGTVKSTKLIRSGDLLVEVASSKQAQQMLKLNALSTIPVSVKPHETLNTCKGVITCGRLLNLPNEEIAQELRGQGIKDVRRINIRRDGALIPTKHFILTFHTPRLPEYIKAGYVRCSVRPYIPNPLRCFKCQRFGHSKTNCRGTLTCARCAVAGHESTGCTAVEQCVNCQGEHTSFSRSCPKWKLEKEVVATKFKNNISFPEARRLVKEQTPPVGGSYASVMQRNHPVYQTTHCPHCHHVVTMSNFPSTSKSPESVPIASSSVTQNKEKSPAPFSQTCEDLPASRASSEFKLVKKKKSKKPSKSQSANNNQVTPDTATKFWKTSPFKASSSAHHKRDKNKTNKNNNENSNAEIANLCFDSSRGNSSDTESDLSVTSAPEVSNTQKNRAKSKSEKSQKLKQAKRGLSQKDLPTKLKKSAHHNSVALGLADRGIVHKDLPSIFGGVPQVPDLKLHPSDEDEDLQMTCDVSVPPTSDLKGLINYFHPVCVGLQETFLSSNIALKLRGYTSVRKDTATGSNHSGGVCILTSNLYPSTPLTLHTSLQAVAVQVHARTLVTVCCVYLPPHDVVSQQDLETLVDQLPTPFILLGDFNGHSTLWGSDVTNSRGRQIERLISNNCLCLLNNDEKTYFHEPTRTFHSLDLAICSPTLLPLLHFTVGSDLCNSDHFPIIVSYADSGGAIQYPPRYLFQRADWGNFMQLADITESMVSTADITEAVQNVIECFIKAANHTIPKSSPRLRKFRRPWWNEACRDSRREEKKLWNIFRRYPTTENHIAFKRAKALARRIRRRSQRESWINFVSSLTSSTSSKQLWKKVKAANGIYREFSFPILNTGNVTHSAPLDIANALGHAFAQVSASDSYSPDFMAIKNRAERTHLRFTALRTIPYNSEFKMCELITALSKAHDTSPGPDGITYNMLRHLNTASLSNLLLLFNRIWTEQEYPSQWHEAIVIPILKPGKDSSNPLNYRPIALTSCLCKTLERMVNARLVFELEKQGCISPLQSGFRRGRSTFDNLVLLETQIRNAFVKRNHLVSVFFDIEKAYDRAWRYGILSTVFNFGFRGNLPIFLKNFLSYRTFRVRVGNFYSNHFIQAEGVPQGSVLSVTLFILHLSQILNHLPSSVRGSLYVDDLQISCQGSNMHLIERQLQNAVNKLIAWCDNNGHTISAEKSRCVHFCRKRNMHLDPNIRIRNSPIPVVNEIRFLGVIFDRKLTFLPHVLHLRKKCEKSLNILKVLSKTSWGADRTSLLRIYQAVILSRIDFGCMVYGSARPTVLRRLDTVHHSALRICSGAFRTSPVESLYVICHQLPLHLRREKLSALYFFRAMSVSMHPINQLALPIGLRRLYDSRPSHILPFCERAKMLLHGSDFNNITIQSFDFFCFPPWDIPQFSYLNPFSGFEKSLTAPVTFQQLFYHHRYQYSSFIPIFTDGSKSDGHVGCGVVSPSDTLSYRLHNFCSIFTAELVAIFCALREISPSNQRKFIIYTDSMSALQTLSHYDIQMHPVALKILSILHFLRKEGFSIIFCWVPSHVGISGNEIADSIAKFASTFLTQDIPYSDVKKSFVSHLHTTWQNNWDLQMNNKLHFVKPFIDMWPILPIRELDVKLTRLRIGHTRFTHKHLIFGERTPVCPTCHTDFSVTHILIECPSFKSHREYHFNSQSLTLQDLVGEKYHPNIFNFLKTIGFFMSI